MQIPALLPSVYVVERKRCLLSLSSLACIRIGDTSQRLLCAILFSVVALHSLYTM